METLESNDITSSEAMSSFISLLLNVSLLTSVPWLHAMQSVCGKDACGGGIKRSGHEWVMGHETHIGSHAAGTTMVWHICGASQANARLRIETYSEQHTCVKATNLLVPLFAWSGRCRRAANINLLHRCDRHPFGIVNEKWIEGKKSFFSFLSQVDYPRYEKPRRKGLDGSLGKGRMACFTGI